MASIYEMREDKKKGGFDLLNLIALGPLSLIPGLEKEKKIASGVVLAAAGAVTGQPALIAMGGQRAVGGVSEAVTPEQEPAVGSQGVPVHRNILPQLEAMSQRYRNNRTNQSKY